MSNDFCMGRGSPISYSSPFYQELLDSQVAVLSEISNLFPVLKQFLKDLKTKSRYGEEGRFSDYSTVIANLEDIYHNQIMRSWREIVGKVIRMNLLHMFSFSGHPNRPLWFFRAWKELLREYLIALPNVARKVGVSA